MTAEGGGSSRTPLEALILALRHSRASHLTGSTVLRQVLGGSYRDLVQSGGFDLASVWDLLAAQPKFDPAEVMPALAKLRSWEAKLGMKVVLPPPMQNLTEAELAEMAQTVHVPAPELARVLRGDKARTAHGDLMEEVEAAARRETPRMRNPPRDTGAPPSAEPRATTPPPRPPRLDPRQRRAVIIAAGAVAVLTFSFAGLTLARGCAGRSWDPVAVEFAAEIPLAGAERSGPEVAATLRDPGWLKLPDGRRRDQMSAALRALPPEVDVFFLRDRAGHVVASARWFGKRPRQIDVTLR